MTIYLKFDTQEQAIDTLQSHDFTMSEYNDHFTGNGWGTLFQVPDNNDWFANVYDCFSNEFDDIKIPEPTTPYNQRA